MTWRWYVLASLVTLLVVALEPQRGGTADGDRHHPDHLSRLMSHFLQEVQKVYFRRCTLLFFHDPPLLEKGPQVANTTVIWRGFDLRTMPGTDEGGPWLDDLLQHTRATPRLMFSLSHDLARVLRDVDLNTFTRCPTYITLARDITTVQDLFLLTEKDWDKYFFSRRHIIFTDSGLASMEKLFRMREMNTMTNLVLAQPGADSSSLDIVTNSPYDQSGLRVLLTWRGGPLTGERHLFPDKLEDLHGHRMRVVTFDFPPRIFMEEQPDGGHLLYGVDIEVVRALSEALNFSVGFSRPTDGEMWGWEQDNGSWTGLMGDLQNRKADIGVADLYIMEHYFAIIDMSIEYDFEYLCFVNLVPGPLPQWMALGLPFMLKTWVAIFVTVLAGMGVLAVLAQLGFRSGRVENTWFQRSTNTSLLLFSCVMNTPWVRVPTSSHLRVFVLLWSLAFIILAVAYKGSLVSYLTVPLERPPIDTHKQLYEKGVAVGSIGYTLKQVMEKNADPNVRLLADRYEHIPSTSEGLLRTVQGEYSFLESRGFLEYTIAVDHTDQRGRASLHVMREYIAPFGIGLAYPKYVPYIPKFNRIIRRLTEAGFAKKWMADIIIRSKQAKISSANRQPDALVSELTTQDLAEVRPLSLDNLQGGFILLALGYALGILSFTVELFLWVYLNDCSRW
ncbi:ionotropic receptor 21a-like [Panulirus ornatus]|uniref:ionotropic receptor 21a-like n=1 Tax=Panulirus ornatus TaxID=150431 RepID=UPI003A83A3BB